VVVTADVADGQWMLVILRLAALCLKLLAVAPRKLSNIWISGSSMGMSTVGWYAIRANVRVHERPLVRVDAG